MLQEMTSVSHLQPNAMKYLTNQINTNDSVYSNILWAGKLLNNSSFELFEIWLTFDHSFDRVLLKEIFKAKFTTEYEENQMQTLRKIASHLRNKSDDYDVWLLLLKLQDSTFSNNINIFYIGIFKILGDVILKSTHDDVTILVESLSIIKNKDIWQVINNIIPEISYVGLKYSIAPIHVASQEIIEASKRYDLSIFAYTRLQNWPNSIWADILIQYFDMGEELFVDWSGRSVLSIKFYLEMHKKFGEFKIQIPEEWKSQDLIEDMNNIIDLHTQIKNGEMIEEIDFELLGYFPSIEVFEIFNRLSFVDNDAFHTEAVNIMVNWLHNVSEFTSLIFTELDNFFSEFITVSRYFRFLFEIFNYNPTIVNKLIRKDSIISYAFIGMPLSFESVDPMKCKSLGLFMNSMVPEAVRESFWIPYSQSLRNTFRFLHQQNNLPPNVIHTYQFNTTPSFEIDLISANLLLNQPYTKIRNYLFNIIIDEKPFSQFLQIIPK
ncbi:MAG: hypothetical protein OEY49_19205, partial [Candidatus Heimdallarchaeota archaeon]|nr:hypothetical protein [Candidatus Heimdallarchaeota archaeon]